MGGLYYPNHRKFPVIGSKDDSGTRSSETLAVTYDGSTQQKFTTGGYSKANFDILYTMGSGESGNSIEVLLEGSPDGTNFYRIANEEASSGTSTIYAREFTFTGNDATTATISIFVDIAYEWMRIEAKETGVAANAGSAYVEVTLSGK